ncbi:hypothetical protein [Raoultella planticola]|uniref:hypothetical protein n=1 Tax=Raoultella planticola TaxID=575 RepID=UPI0005179FED|nr:hypothetical protein [Raoultella planticola]
MADNNAKVVFSEKVCGILNNGEAVFLSLKGAVNYNTVTENAVLKCIDEDGEVIFTANFEPHSSLLQSFDYNIRISKPVLTVDSTITEAGEVVFHSVEDVDQQQLS